MASSHDELKVQMTHGLTLTVMFRSLPVIWQNLGLLSRFGIPGLNGNSVLYECCRETSRSIHCIGVHLTPIVKTNMTSSLRWLPLNAPVNKSLRSRSPSEAMLDISDTTPLKDLKRGAAGVTDDLPELLSLQCLRLRLLRRLCYYS